MIVTRNKNYNPEGEYYDYYFKDGNQELSIVFRGNGDLYFCSKAFTKEQEAEFYITKENMIIYNIFEELFDNFYNAKIYILSNEESHNFTKETEYNTWNKYLKNSTLHKNIINKNTLTWISDNSISFNYETADSLRVIKEENSFHLKFTYYENEFPYLRSIRIRNSGSRYLPFNVIMMNFFNKLQEYNPDEHQMHIEEYLYLKNNSKKLTKKL